MKRIQSVCKIEKLSIISALFCALVLASVQQTLTLKYGKLLFVYSSYEEDFETNFKAHNEVLIRYLTKYVFNFIDE
jgi:hypothetical protein